MTVLDGPFRPIHYLGSKLRVGAALERIISEVEPSGGRVCDLFAGSGTLSGYLARTRAVTTVDIQEYSRVLCIALTQRCQETSDLLDGVTDRVVRSSMYATILKASQPLSADESARLSAAAQGNLRPLAQLLEGSAVSESTRPEWALLPSACRSFIQFFGGLYFSYRQAADLAAIVQFAHEREGHERAVILFAAMSAASEVVNTVGKQFAQPIRLVDRSGALKVNVARQVVRDRQIDVFQKFGQALSTYKKLPGVVEGSRSIRADYTVALENECADASVIYADPPYTRDHYSRYYHVLETMCYWDVPDISTDKHGVAMRGMYRSDRHQSPFCIKSKAPLAFQRLLAGTRKIGVPAVVSYSPLAETSKPRPRVMSLEDIRQIALSNYREVDLVSVGNISHSKLNSARHNSAVTQGAEIAFVCQRPR